jgi:hypothetical protein
MARPLRIEFPGAVYHLTSRGDRREDIFTDDEDRRGLLEVVAQALSRFDTESLAYCLMDNHYHFKQAWGQALPFAPSPCNLPIWPDPYALNSPAPSTT